MAHADDDGLVLPPRVAPQQVVIIPIIPKPEHAESVLAAADALAAQLSSQTFLGDPIRVHIDRRDLGGGVKKWEWVKKGAPVRLEIGPRDVESGSVAFSQRDRPATDKEFLPAATVVAAIADTLAGIHANLLARATEFRDANILPCSNIEEFHQHWQATQPGWLLTPWAASDNQEETLSKQHKIAIRCFPNDLQEQPEAPCILTGTPTRARALWGRSY
jgi:prolyl-tRNA synthetase